MSVPVNPGRISPEELARLQVLGEEVRQVLTSVGLTAFFDPNPLKMTGQGPGAYISIDHTTAGRVIASWECSEDLGSRASAAFNARDFHDPDMRLNARAGLAMGEAMTAILREAGYEAGLGYDMDPGCVWVKRVPA
jgi:hypothetical protein